MAPCRRVGIQVTRYPQLRQAGITLDPCPAPRPSRRLPPPSRTGSAPDAAWKTESGMPPVNFRTPRERLALIDRAAAIEILNEPPSSPATMRPRTTSSPR